MGFPKMSKKGSWLQRRKDVNSPESVSPDSSGPSSPTQKKFGSVSRNSKSSKDFTSIRTNPIGPSSVCFTI